MTITPVDLGLMNTDLEAFAAALGRSYQQCGFAVVAGHDLPAPLIDGTLGCFRTFFARDDAAKRRYHVPGGHGQRGYTPFGVETAKGATAHDLKEFWHVGRELPAGHPYRRWMPDNLWVDDIPGFRDNTYGLYQAMDAFGRRLLKAIACFLKLPLDWFDDKVNLGNSVLRVLHYPPQGDDVAPGHVRAGAHEDINVITLLLGADEGGLEVLDRQGRWLAIQPPEGCLVVNIGDMLQRLSNHVLPSTTHRVVNPAPERRRIARYSMPFFLHFNPDFVIETLPGCVTAERPDRYPAPITAQAYLEQRLREIKLM